MNEKNNIITACLSIVILILAGIGAYNIIVKPILDEQAEKIRQEQLEKENEANRRPSTADYDTEDDNPENNRWQNGIISDEPQEDALIITINGKTLRFGSDEHSVGTFIINPRIDDNKTPYFIHCITNDGAVSAEGNRVNAYKDDLSNSLYLYQADESFTCINASYVDFENYGIGWSISNTIDSPKVVVKFVNAETFALEYAIEICLKHDESYKYSVDYIKDVTEFENSKDIEKSAIYCAKQSITAFEYVDIESVKATQCFDIDYNYWIDAKTKLEVSRANIFTLPAYAVTMTLQDNPYTNYTIYLDANENYLGYVEFTLIEEYAAYEEEEILNAGDYSFDEDIYIDGEGIEE